MPKKDLSTSASKKVFSTETFTDSDGRQLLYRAYSPKTKLEKLPLVIFLHGAGERGQDNEMQLVHIAPILTNAENLEKYPAHLIFPQCPTEDYWAPVEVKDGVWTVGSRGLATPPMQSVIELIEERLKDPTVDKNRIYIAGLSMGGFGTLDILSRHPEWFAAGISICAGGDKQASHNYKQVPLFLFHGAKDRVVSVEFSRELYSHLQDHNSNIQYTEYPEGGHNVWNKAFEDPKTLEWLFSHVKN